ncbi:helix-turn-helix domain-containing protein, partial [Caenispirillum bisanense]|uniref:helix-turn-helix domain-containing protein n=1 Tax=Caenispirillum bisanense TaxID=414052 RepID=UPI0031D2858E
PPPPAAPPLRAASPAAAAPPLREVAPEGDEDDFESILDDDYDGGGGMTPRQRLISAMEKAGWVQAKAARLLGLTPRQIGYALKKYNIEVKRL